MKHEIHKLHGSSKGTGRRTDAVDDPGARIRAHSCHPVLLLLHQKSSSTGAIGDWLQRRGYDLDIRRPTLGEALPQSLDKHAGVIVFGGPMSANDNTPKVRSEIDWLALVLEQKIPYFGSCLGAQMMVSQLGGVVKRHEKALVEIGYHPIKATIAGKKLISNWPERCFHWHNEGFSLPTGSVALATGTRFKNQANISSVAKTN